MSYLQRNNEFSRGKDRRKSIWIIIVFIFIILLGLFGPFDIFVKSPAKSSWGFSNFISKSFLDNLETLRSKKSLLNDKEMLEEKIIFYQKDIFFLDVLKKENEELKEILGRTKKNANLVVASILVKPGFSPYDILIIDAGESDGIALEDKVLVDGNTFIGEISEVDKNTAKVRLYSSPGEKVMVLIGPSNIQKEAVGLGAGNFMLELSKEMTVNEGDTVIIPSITPNVFGIVEKIEQKPADSFQKILFKSPVNAQEMRYVQVITK